ncbi:dihydroneopterin aldolase [Leptothrix cholodnii SP-6]|uniref:dihydroneopterin aldolase n=1 Tax=Leptothrix cholodnii (strain ATCC 51168 / LMG 8142 / SP-6) TaxID=395495 RepID=B1Y0Y9_LEPCP|nr:dihydroneopterin aldolase [Leptothrix cholodnii]ACB35406.1 dihydroneopterin aldolase [Leptothrix cholodnii SP-6]
MSALPALLDSLPPQPHGHAPAAAPMDLIFISGYTGQTVIGIHESELHHTQPLVIDIHAGLPRARACDTDHIGDTIDYGVVRNRLDALMHDHGVTLLEALAERIARMLLIDFGAAWVRVKVVKPRKFDNVDAVGVQIERCRADLRDVPMASTSAAASTPRSAQILSWMGSGLVPQDR